MIAAVVRTAPAFVPLAAGPSGIPSGMTSGTSQTSRGALLADIVQTNKQLVARYLAGFNDVTHVRQTPDLPNHLAWQLGHLALTMHRVSGMLDGGPIPASEFVKGDGFSGSREKGVFDIEAVAFGSRPEDRHDRYPKQERCVEVFNSACDRLSAAVAGVSDARLDEVVPWGQAQMPLWALVARMVFHNGFHTGQIADMRRALGFRSVFG